MAVVVGIIVGELRLQLVTDGEQYKLPRQLVSNTYFQRSLNNALVVSAPLNNQRALFLSLKPTAPHRGGGELRGLLVPLIP